MTTVKIQNKYPLNRSTRLIDTQRTTDEVLREAAFILEMTRRVKDAILSEQEVPRANNSPAECSLATSL